MEYVGSRNLHRLLVELKEKALGKRIVLVKLPNSLFYQVLVGC